MSLRGRYVIDRIKRALPSSLRLPVPPYHHPSYWENVYRQLGPQDIFEWGHISGPDLFEYNYKLNAYSIGEETSTSSTTTTSQQHTSSTTFGETLNVHPNANQDETILMLGCGNSQLGEQMILANWRGPIFMVDVAARVVESMSLRCQHLQTHGDMQFVQDDATVLSAFSDETIHAVLDKGLMDAIFCADDLDSCYKILTSVHRVLKPGACFVCLSFSRPEFLLNQVLLSNNKLSFIDTSKRRLQWFQSAWKDVQIRELDRIFLYRFQKATKVSDTLKRPKQSRR